MCTIPRIDMVNTGLNITRLRKANNLSVKEVQDVLGFNTPQALYKWEIAIIHLITFLVRLAERMSDSDSEDSGASPLPEANMLGQR